MMTSGMLVVLLAVVAIGQGVKVVDLAGSFGNFSCLAQQGFSHSIIRAFHSYGAIDVTAPGNILKSNQAGLSTDVYMFPCRGKNAEDQANQLAGYLESMMSIQAESLYGYQTGTIWLDIETNPSPSCSWSIGTPQSNCQFIKDLIAALQAKKRVVGIYATGYMWNQIMGNRDYCPYFSTYPLWYAHYDGKDNFDDWPTNKFGGWTEPTIKQYSGSSSVCGYTFDLSFY